MTEVENDEAVSGKSEKKPRWFQHIPGVLGSLWVLSYVGYIFWTMVLTPGLTLLGKSLITALCVTGIALVAVVVLPVKGIERVRPDEVGPGWLSLLRAPPTDPGQYALWRKFRRLALVLLSGMVLMLAWGVAVGLGLVKE